MRPMRDNFIITKDDLTSIEDAIAVLREYIQARGDSTDTSINEARSALTGLLCIMPKPEPTWQPVQQ